MVNTNYFSGIVKILETPKTCFFDSETQVTRFQVEISQKRKNSIISLLIWGNLGKEVQKFYKENDYILIEGYTSIRPKQNLKSSLKNSKQVFITVVKVYPILLDTNRISTKL
jgi:hypothetical protein